MVDLQDCKEITFDLVIPVGDNFDDDDPEDCNKGGKGKGMHMANTRKVVPRIVVGKDYVRWEMMTTTNSQVLRGDPKRLVQYKVLDSSASRIMC